jgi:hypothetical protein
MAKRSDRRVGLVAACDDRELFAFDLWPRQRELLAAVERARINPWALGRRSGKTVMAGVVCLHDCLLRPELDSMVRRGETRYAVAVATNLQQARLIVQAARSIVERSPLLAGLLESATEDELRFRSPSGASTALRAFPCSSRGGRGWPISCLVMDEAAHFVSTDDGYQCAARVWAALVPSTAQFAGHARIIVASTPYGTSGLFADLHARALAGELEGAEAQHATTAQVNPTIDPAFLEVEERRDPDGFRSEYLAEFTGSGDAFLDFDRIDLAGAPVARPGDAQTWVAGLDPAFSKDPFGYALVGRVSDGRLVVGPVGALRAGGSFSGPVDAVAVMAREYGARVVADQFSSAAVIERLRREHGLQASVRTMTATSKTEIFQSLRARLYDCSLVLPDHPALVGELRRLRTRFSTGQSAVVNPRVGGSHGDAVQALALAVHEQGGGRQSDAFKIMWTREAEEAQRTGVDPAAAAALRRLPKYATEMGQREIAGPVCRGGNRPAGGSPAAPGHHLWTAVDGELQCRFCELWKGADGA